MHPSALSSITNSVVTDSLFNTTICICSKGTYVLQDNNFQLLTQMSDGKQYTEDAPKV